MTQGSEVPSRAQISALDAVKSAAAAATASAQAAQAAAEAAQVAAQAAHIAVTGSRPVAAPVAPVARRNEIAPGVTGPGGTAVATVASPPPEAAPATGPASVATSARVRPADTAQVFTRTDIETSGHTSVADFLREQSVNALGSSRPGFANPNSGNALLDLRGLGADRTLVLLNGRRIAPAVNAGGSLIQNLNTLPLAAVERIEISADGMSARYGADALGGVVNIITRDTFNGLQATAGLRQPELGGGEESYYSVAGGASGALGHMSFAAERGERDAALDDTGFAMAPGVARDTAFVSAALTPLPGVSVYAEGAYGAVNTFADTPDNELSNDDFAHAVVGATLHTSALGGVTLDASAQRGRARADVDGGTLNQSTELDGTRAQLRLGGLRLPGLHLPVYVGAEQTDTRFRTDVWGQRKVTSTFGGASLRVLNWIDLDYRLREDLFATRDEPILSERFAAGIALLPGVRVRGSYATGFGLATFGEQFGGQRTGFAQAVDYTLCEKSGAGTVAAGENGLPEVSFPPGTPDDSPCRAQSYVSRLGGNAGIDPETSEHWRAGLDVLVPAMALSLDAYRIELSNTTGTPQADATIAAEWLAGGSDNVVRRANSAITSLDLTARNEGSLTTRGAELDLRLGNYLDPQLPIGLRVMAHYIDDYLVSTVNGVAGTLPVDLLIPEWRANVGLRFTPTRSTTLQVAANYIGESLSADSSQWIEDWFTVDAQLALQLPWKGAVTFGVRNLFDQGAPLTSVLGDRYFDPSRYPDFGISPYVRYRQAL